LAKNRFSVGSNAIIRADEEIRVFMRLSIRRVLGWTFSLCLLAPANLRADLTIRQVALLSGGMFEGLKSQAEAEKRMDEITSDIYVRKNQVREDEFYGKELVQSTIYSMARGEIITLNHLYKTYSIETFAHFKKKAPPPPPNTPEADTQQNARNPLGLTTSTKDLGEEKKINGFDTHHYSMVTKLPGPQGDAANIGEFELVSDLWMSKENLGYGELEQFRSALIQELGDTEDARAALPPKEVRTSSQVVLALAEIYRFAQERNAAPIRAVSEFRIKFFPPGSEKLPDGKGNPEKIHQPSTAARAGDPSVPPAKNGTDPIHGTRLFMRVTREVNRIAQTTLEDSLFEIPKDYKRTGK
jgi:hypothetical protein